MSNRSLIIADLHLNPNEVEKNQLFINFCQNEASAADQLFILGDLFNTWLGDDLSIPIYQQIVDALRALSQHTQIFLMHGNRDFLLADEFARQSGVTLISTPYLLESDLGDFVLTHGDELCTDDESYQQLKSILQHTITKFIFIHLPKKLRLKLAGQLRKKSVEAQQTKTIDIMDVNEQTVISLMQKYPQANLIHGHTHRLNTHKNADFTRYVLGDWKSDLGNAISIDSELNWLEIH